MNQDCINMIVGFLPRRLRRSLCMKFYLDLEKCVMNQWSKRPKFAWTLIKNNDEVCSYYKSYIKNMTFRDIKYAIHYDNSTKIVKIHWIHKKRLDTIIGFRSIFLDRFLLSLDDTIKMIKLFITHSYKLKINIKDIRSFFSES